MAAALVVSKHQNKIMPERQIMPGLQTHVPRWFQLLPGDDSQIRRGQREDCVMFDFVVGGLLMLYRRCYMRRYMLHEEMKIRAANACMKVKQGRLRSPHGVQALREGAAWEEKRR